MPQKCSGCGVEIPEGSKLEACPRCLLGLGLIPGSVSEGQEPAEGARVGAYKLLEKIGEGGLGVVYMAEQEEPIRRRVAIKLIKPGMDSREIIVRFEAERQALALMEHPNIATIFDAGTTDNGRPYFVMELVRGVRITDYCDSHNLSTRERLDLFVQISQAVQHAHQKGVIHRDLKPSNILVTVNDGVPVPKIIDFGIAKATQQRLTDKTLFTRFNQLLGTPAYMSPEQADLTSLDIDTRADIYSLGVLLYELLTGRTPFDSKELFKAGLERMLQIIRESEPARPSARLSTLTAEELTTVASRRQIKGSDLLRLFRGDLDWIVMKCLEKDRGRRYETPAALAADIERHLRKEVVRARPPSTGYRIARFVQRNRLLVTASSLVVGTLITAAVISIVMARSARQSERTAQTAREAEENESYKGRIALARTHIENGAPEQARQSLDGAVTRLRDWEWHWLNQCVKAMPESLLPPPQSVNSAAFSSDGTPSLRNVNSAAFSSDGTRFVLSGGGSMFFVWDVPVRQVWTVTNSGSHQADFHVGFTADSQRVFSAKQGSIGFWDVRKSNCVFRFSPPRGEIFAVSSLGDRIATIVSRPDHDEFSFWDTGSGLAPFRLLSTITNPVSPSQLFSTNRFSDQSPRVIFSRDLRRMFTEVGRVDSNALARFANSTPISERDKPRWRGHNIQRATLFRRRIWDTDTGRLLVMWPESSEQTLHLDARYISPDGKKMLVISPSRIRPPQSRAGTSEGSESRARMYETDSGRQIATWGLGYNSSMEREVVFSPNANAVAITRAFVTRDSDGTERRGTVVEVWESGSGKLMAAFKLQRPTADITQTGGWSTSTNRTALLVSTTRDILTFTPDSVHLVANDTDEQLYICNVTNGHVFSALTFQGKLRAVGGAILSPDGRRILTGIGTHVSPLLSKPLLWDLGGSEGSLILRSNTDEGYALNFQDAVFSPDSKYVACAYELRETWEDPKWRQARGFIKVYDLSSGHEISTIKTTNQISELAFSSDSRRLMTRQLANSTIPRSDGSFMGYDIVSYELPAGVEVARVPALGVSFSPDGRWMIRVSNPPLYTHRWLTNDVPVRVWDANTSDLVVNNDGRGQFRTLTLDKQYLVELKPKRQLLDPGTLEVRARIPEGVAGPCWYFPQVHRLLAAVMERVEDWPNHQAIFVLFDSNTGRRVASWDAKKSPEGWPSWPTVYGGVASENRCIVVNRTDSLEQTHSAIVMDTSTGARISELIGHVGGVRQAWLLPKGKRAVTVDIAGLVRVWETDSGREMLFFTSDREWNMVTVSPDGQRLLTADEDRLLIRSATPGLGVTRLSPQYRGMPLAPGADLVATRYSAQTFAEIRAFQHRQRRGETAPQQLDLSRHYNTHARLREAVFQNRPYTLDWLPIDPGAFADVKFDSRGVIAPQRTAINVRLPQRGVANPRSPEYEPTIAVERYSRRIHFLHGALGTAEEGTHIAHYFIHYADGQTNTVRVAYGEDVRDCLYDPKPLANGSRSAVAWEGKAKTGSARLFRTTWDNPRPGTEVTSINWTWSRGPTVFLSAITVEDAEAPTWTVAE